jgi:hypothetical protein
MYLFTYFPLVESSDAHPPKSPAFSTDQYLFNLGTKCLFLFGLNKTDPTFDGAFMLRVASGVHPLVMLLNPVVIASPEEF